MAQSQILKGPWPIAQVFLQMLLRSARRGCSSLCKSVPEKGDFHTPPCTGARRTALLSAPTCMCIFRIPCVGHSFVRQQVWILLLGISLTVSALPLHNPVTCMLSWACPPLENFPLEEVQCYCAIAVVNMSEFQNAFWGSES